MDHFIQRVLLLCVDVTQAASSLRGSVPLTGKSNYHASNGSSVGCRPVYCLFDCCDTYSRVYPFSLISVCRGIMAWSKVSQPTGCTTQLRKLGLYRMRVLPCECEQAASIELFSRHRYCRLHWRLALCYFIWEIASRFSVTLIVSGIASLSIHNRALRSSP